MIKFIAKAPILNFRPFGALLALFLISCGDGKSEKKREEEIHYEGVFLAALAPVNPKLERTINGSVRISRYSDHFYVTIKVNGAPPGAHMQLMHMGSECPNITHDLNGDGIVDYEEARARVGRVLIPFDGDLRSRRLGINSFPYGNYHYKKSVSYALLLGDLQHPDESLPPDYRHIEDHELNMHKRVIMIYGSEKPLPPSVSRMEGRSNHNSVPIACGILVYATDTPNEEDWPVFVPKVPLPEAPGPRPDNTWDYEGPEKEPVPTESWWGRMSGFARRAWCRIRRCSYSNGELKPVNLIQESGE